MMRDPDLLSVDAEEDWLCPECDAPYSKPGIEADLVAYVDSHPSAGEPRFGGLAEQQSHLVSCGSQVPAAARGWEFDDGPGLRQVPQRQGRVRKPPATCAPPAQPVRASCPILMDRHCSVQAVRARENSGRGIAAPTSRSCCSLSRTSRSTTSSNGWKRRRAGCLTTRLTRAATLQCLTHGDGATIHIHSSRVPDQLPHHFSLLCRARGRHRRRAAAAPTQRGGRRLLLLLRRLHLLGQRRVERRNLLHLRRITLGLGLQLRLLPLLRAAPALLFRLPALGR